MMTKKHNYNNLLVIIILIHCISHIKIKGILSLLKNQLIRNKI